MYILISLIIFLLIIVVIALIYSKFRLKIQFMISGLDAGFSLLDLSTLWQTSQLCGLEMPTSLFYSPQSLTTCMTRISQQTNTGDFDLDDKNQRLLSKLFAFRTKLQNKTDDKKGILSTKYLDKDQTLRIILPGKGVFVSEILNNGSQLIISVPRQKGIMPFPAEQWVGKVVSVYLWRKDDGRYAFDTSVNECGLFLGHPSISLKHCVDLVRTQKRKSVRAKCEIYGNLFIVKKSTEENSIETKNGYKCLIQDISESGALIKIGGKGIENVKIKLQFTIQNKLILMFGVIRTVEFNEEENQSLLHFECTKIETSMKNEILSFVYNMLPDSEKEIIEAINQTSDDEKDENNENSDELKTDENHISTENSTENIENQQDDSEEGVLEEL